MNHMPLKRRNRIALPVAAIPAMALCLLAPTTSFAAESEAPAHVIVEAARVTKKVVGRTDIGAPIELMSLRAHVKYSDLDLATSAGAARLPRPRQDVSADRAGSRLRKARYRRRGATGQGGRCEGGSEGACRPMKARAACASGSRAGGKRGTPPDKIQGSSKPVEGE